MRSSSGTRRSPAVCLIAAAVLVGACGGSDDAQTEKASARPQTATAANSFDTNPSASPPPAVGPPADEAGSSQCTRIVVDPGHDSRANPATEPIGPGSSKRKIKDGGGTRGVVSGRPESLVNLQISLRLRKLLEADGYCVTMTRTRQTGVSMGNVARARIANRARAALFVRIHADGNPSRAHHGSAVLYPAVHRGWTDDV